MNSAIGVTALLIISMSWQHEPPMFYKGWIREDHPDILMTVYDHIAEPHQPHITVGYLIAVCKKRALALPMPLFGASTLDLFQSSFAQSGDVASPLLGPRSLCRHRVQ